MYFMPIVHDTYLNDADLCPLGEPNQSSYGPLVVSDSSKCFPLLKHVSLQAARKKANVAIYNVFRHSFYINFIIGASRISCAS